MIAARLLVLIAFLAIGASPVLAECIEKAKDAVSYTVCTFDPAEDDIRVFNTDETDTPLETFASLNRFLWLDRHYLRFAMNGGMYHHNLRPVGLHVENGRELKAASTAAGWGNFHLLPNGVFALSGGKAVVQETGAYLKSGFDAAYATQSGPMLVIEGKLHPRFLPDSDSLKRRNGVGVDGKGRAVFVISREPVRFYDLAAFFRDDLGCSNALFLDGTISSVFVPETGRNDRLFPMGPMIGVIERAR